MGCASCGQKYHAQQQNSVRRGERKAPPQSDGVEAASTDSPRPSLGKYHRYVHPRYRPWRKKPAGDE